MTTTLHRRHARKRFRQRYDGALNRSTLRSVILCIQRGRSVPICRTSNRVCLHMVDLGGKQAVAVYDSDRHSIVTFLPANCREARRAAQ